MVSKKSPAKTFTFYLVVLIVCAVMVFPLYWMLISAFKVQVDIIAWPPKFRFKPTMANFKEVLFAQHFMRYLKNSTIVALASVSISLVLGLPAAYAIARNNMKKTALFILVARLMPGISFLMPWYIIFSRLKLMDSYIALVLSHILISLPLTIWTMEPYFRGIPIEMDESAMIDGASRTRTFISIVLPLAGPGIVTATTLSFIFSWNNFMFSQVLSRQKTRTLPIAVNNFLSYASIDWGGVMAAAVFIMLPAIVITMIFQKYVIKGLTAGAVKG